MKTTARARIEQAVENFARRENYCVGSDILYREDVVKFVLAERARLKREVKKLPRILGATTSGQFYESVQLRDILALLEK